MIVKARSSDDDSSEVYDAVFITTRDALQFVVVLIFNCDAANYLVCFFAVV